MPLEIYIDAECHIVLLAKHRTDSKIDVFALKCNTIGPAHMCVLMCALAPPQRLLPGVYVSLPTFRL